MIEIIKILFNSIIKCYEWGMFVCLCCCFIVLLICSLYCFKFCLLKIVIVFLCFYFLYLFFIRILKKGEGKWVVVEFIILFLEVKDEGGKCVLYIKL